MVIFSKRLFNSYKYIIKPGKVEYFITERSTTENGEIKFEELGGRKRYNKKNELPILIIGTVLVLGGLFCILFLDSLTPMKKEDMNTLKVFPTIIGAGLCVVYFVTKDENYRIEGGSKTIKIPVNNKNIDKISKQIDDLLTVRKDYLRNKYMNVYENVDYDNQFGIYQWLLDQEVLSDDEFRQHTKILAEKCGITPPKKIQGFN